MSLLNGSIERDEHGRPVGWDSYQEPNIAGQMLGLLGQEVAGNARTAYGEWDQFMQDPVGNIQDSLLNWPPVDKDKWWATEDHLMSAMDSIAPGAGLLGDVVGGLAGTIKNQDIRRAVDFHQKYDKPLINPETESLIDIANMSRSDQAQLRNYGKSLNYPATRVREIKRATGDTVLQGEYIRPTGKKMTAEDLENRAIINLNADRTARGKDIYEVGGHKLSRPVYQEGGWGYPEEYGDFASLPGAAVTKQNHANIAAERAAELTGEPPVMVYTPNDLHGSNFSTMPTDVAYQMLGDMPVSKNTLGLLDTKIREFKGAGGTRPGEDFVGIQSGEAYDQLMGIGDFAKEGSGQLRKAFMETLSQPGMQARGLPHYWDIQRAVTDPELWDVPNNMAGGLLVQAKPGAEAGGLVMHNSYTGKVPAKKLGLMDFFPEQLMYKDMVDWKGRPTPRSHRSVQVGQHVQIASPEWVDQMMLYQSLSPEQQRLMLQELSYQ